MDFKLIAQANSCVLFHPTFWDRMGVMFFCLKTGHKAVCLSDGKLAITKGVGP